MNESTDIAKYAGYVKETFDEKAGLKVEFSSLINTKMAKIMATASGYRDCSIDANTNTLIIP